MFTHFLFPTISFVIHVLSAFAAFVMAWVIFDALQSETKNKKKYPKQLQGVGFVLLGFYFLLARPFELEGALLIGFEVAFLLALFCILVGLYMELTPFLRDGKAALLYRPNRFVALLLVLPLLLGVFAFLSIDVLVVTYLFLMTFLLLVKGWKGQRRQIRPLVWGFFFLFFAQTSVLLNSLLADDLRFDFWTGPTGMLSILDLVFVLAAFPLLVGRYAQSFLRFRMRPAIFMNFFTSSLFIFISIVVIFLIVLLNDFQANTLFNLKASSNALELAVVELKNDAILAAKALRSNVIVLNGVELEDPGILGPAVQGISDTSSADVIIVTNEAGLSLYDTSRPDVYGTNFSEDKYLLRALEGETTNTLTTEPGVLAPMLVAKTYLPVVQNEQIIGAVMVEFFVDDQMLDGLKQKTGLDMTLFVGNTRSATTFTMDGGRQRMNGTFEDNEEVLETVLVQGEVFEGTVNVFNEEYLGVYSPLKDDDENILGMIFVGEPSRILLAIASESVQITLRITSLLVLLSVIPNYIFARRAIMSQMI